MVTKKQLAALARGRAIRARNLKTKHTTKRTSKKKTKEAYSGGVDEKYRKGALPMKNYSKDALAEYFGIGKKKGDKIEYPIVVYKPKSTFKQNAKEIAAHVGKTLWDITKYIATFGWRLSKAAAKGIMNDLSEQTERLLYMRYLLASINEAMDKFNNKTPLTELKKTKKNIKILTKMAKLEKEENPNLPIKIIKDIMAIPVYFNSIYMNNEEAIEADKKKSEKPKAIKNDEKKEEKKEETKKAEEKKE